MRLAGVVGVIQMFSAVGIAKDANIIGAQAAHCWVLLALVCELSFAYLACFLQQRALEIHVHYGGAKANGLVPLLAAVFFLRPAVADALDSTPLLRIVFA